MIGQVLGHCRVVAKIAHGAMQFFVNLILDLWRYADFTELIPPWKGDSFRLGDKPENWVPVGVNGAPVELFETEST